MRDDHQHIGGKNAIEKRHDTQADGATTTRRYSSARARPPEGAHAPHAMFTR